MPRDRPQAVSMMKHALALLAVLPFSGCSCDEPLVELGDPAGNVTTTTAIHARGERPALHAAGGHAMDVTGDAIDERAPIVVDTCGQQSVSIAPEVASTVFGEFQAVD